MSAPDPDQALTARLMTPEAWPHPVETPIRVVETHVSRVFLTGRWAYKVRKPVRYAFLDYGTLDRRLACCNEELRLNERTAPGLCVGVSPIAGPPATARVDGAGEPIEYAVRMHQFDRRLELDALIDAGGASAPELAALGADLAALHATAARLPAGSTWWAPDAVSRVMRDNLDELETLATGAHDADALHRLRSDLLLAMADAGPTLARRRDDGYVRECHGDLHCANVVRWNGRLSPFDAIDFDPKLRWIDVANDLAFLAMDLDVRGRRDLRAALLQGWFDASGDAEALRLLPALEAGRALVRAKVAALGARQHDGEAAAAGRRIAARYLDWAAARLRRSRPALIATCGYSGSGKTTLARTLAVRLDALHLRSDVERKRLAGLGALEDSRSPQDGGIYTLDYNRLTYRRLAECAEHALAGGCTVVVDAAFLRQAEREALLAVAAGAAAPTAILHCTAPMDVLRARVASRMQRGHDASEAGLATLDRQPGYWEAFTPAEQPHVIGVDTLSTDPLPACLAALAGHGIG